MKCSIEKDSAGMKIQTTRHHGFKPGDTVRLSVHRPDIKAKPAEAFSVAAFVDKIEPRAGKLIEGGNLPSARLQVAVVANPTSFTVSSSEQITAAADAEANPCDNTVDPIYYITCCILGLGCDAAS